MTSAPTDSLWYLAICVECSGGLAGLTNRNETPMAVPFGDEEERHVWVTEHMTTGHSVLLMNQTRE